jgi:hypothetical protein
MNSAINYFFEQNPGTANNNCKIYFDFEDNTQNGLITNKSGDFFISGLVSPNINNNTWQNSNSIFLDSGNYIKVFNTTGIDHKNFTAALIFETRSSGGGILISTISSGIFPTFDEFGSNIDTIIYKGFNFGLTANHKLFFEYYENNGPEVFLSDFNLSDKNSIFLKITDNNLTFGHFDFNQGKLISNSFYINTKYLFDQNSIFLGYNPNNANLYTYNKIFTGIFDQFLIFSPFIYDYDLVNLNSGFMHLYDTGNFYTNIENLTGVTGYGTIITGYETIITGIEYIETGVILDEFGVAYSGYSENVLTGLSPLLDIIELTGIIDSSITSGFSGARVIFNNKYHSEFNKKCLNLMSKIDSEDFIEINLITGENIDLNFQKNLNLIFKKYNNYFIVDNNTNGSTDYIIYVNGQLQKSGLYYITGSVYSSGILIESDYYTLNDRIYFNNNYNENNNFCVDSISGINTGLYISNFSVNTGVGFFELTGWNGYLYNIYFNGLKLIENVHYEIFNENTLLFYKTNGLYSGCTGDLVGIPKNSNNIITGNNNLFFQNSGYFLKSSEVYKNGVRQKLNNDYLELAKFDTNSRQGFFDNKSDIIYNNEGFFNL